MKYLILGNSAAAVGCVEGIRKTDKNGPITLVSDEMHSVYSRPLISYWLAGKVLDEGMAYRPADFYKKNKVEALLGQKCVSIDPAAKKAVLEDGRELAYDRLMVATGSRPFVPPVPGLRESPDTLTFLSWDSAAELKKRMTEKSRVVVLGAGLIGLKVCEGIAAHVQSVTVVEMAPHLMPSILDDVSAGIVQKHIEKNGVSFIYSDPAAKVEGKKLLLGSGNALDFDILVVATGVRMNAELVKEAGGEVNRGILINDRMQTSLPDVYAGGDCVEAVDTVTGERKIMALLPNAYMQGEAAGVNMAGGEKMFDKSMLMNAIGFFGLPMVTAGSYDGKAYLEAGSDFYKKLVFKDNRLVGYILINDVDRAGIYTALIREKVDLTGVDIDLLKKHPQLMMFGRGDRKRILAGGGIAK